ncbi:MAG: hypothetical protein BWX62_00502 [Bacteroidetes bacterium ADurb.Bin037]|nr:MAG: hypothetical protein BWX62_00502 [Bacteroidetes bacterium ADurb.Bin037]HPW79068.1 nucleotidyl transferase AbiEii/AbiGii toxin family protein [Bacteroidales bacterium]
MLLQSEILRIAEKEGVPPDTIDKNWVLGHFLAILFEEKWARENLIFKGGTCLKKCYFEKYRFSEDLDFTLKNKDLQITNRMLQSVCDTVTGKVGILFSKVKVEPINWKNKQVGYKTKIKFWGANHKNNQQPPAAQRWQTEFKIEIVHYEKLVNNPVYKPLLSTYSDSGVFVSQTIPCYPLVEIIGEKLRALLQRSYPAPRDYYDIWKLLKQPELLEDWNLIVKTFLQKTAFKHITFNDYSDFFNNKRINKMKKEWDHSLRGHLREEDFPDVNQIIHELETVFQRMNWH